MLKERNIISIEEYNEIQALRSSCSSQIMKSSQLVYHKHYIFQPTDSLVINQLLIRAIDCKEYNIELTENEMNVINTLPLHDYLPQLLNSKCDRIFITGLFIIYSLNKVIEECVDTHNLNIIFDRVLKIRSKKMQYKNILNNIMIMFTSDYEMFNKIDTYCGRSVLLEIMIANQNLNTIYLSAFVQILGELVNNSSIYNNYYYLLLFIYLFILYR